MLQVLDSEPRPDAASDHDHGQYRVHGEVEPEIQSVGMTIGPQLESLTETLGSDCGNDDAKDNGQYDGQGKQDEDCLGYLAFLEDQCTEKEDRYCLEYSVHQEPESFIYEPNLFGIVYSVQMDVGPG